MRAFVGFEVDFFVWGWGCFGVLGFWGLGFQDLGLGFREVSGHNEGFTFFYIRFRV